jgi:hypothetical protein
MRDWLLALLLVAVFAALSIGTAALWQEGPRVPIEHQKIYHSLTLLAGSLFTLLFVGLTTCVHVTLTSKPRTPNP